MSACSGRDRPAVRRRDRHPGRGREVVVLDSDLPGWHPLVRTDALRSREASSKGIRAARRSGAARPAALVLQEHFVTSLPGHHGRTVGEAARRAPGRRPDDCPGRRLRRGFRPCWTTQGDAFFGERAILLGRGRCQDRDDLWSSIASSPTSPWRWPLRRAATRTSAPGGPRAEPALRLRRRSTPATRSGSATRIETATAPSSGGTRCRIEPDGVESGHDSAKHQAPELRAL